MSDEQHEPGQQLHESEELLYRQVHPNFVEAGQVSSQAFELSSQSFRVTPADQGLLSVARAALTTPEMAFVHHTNELAKASAGTWGVTVGECSQLGLPAHEDPVLANGPEGFPADPAHACINHRGLSRNQAKKKARALRNMAQKRGNIYRP